MAEGQVYDNPETGESWVETVNGELVRTTTGRVPAVAAGIGSGAKDILYAPAGLLDVLGGAFDVVGLDEAAAGIRGGAQAVRDARARLTTDFEQAAQSEYPYSFLGGEMAGGFLPGSATVQGVIGATQGIGMTETAAGGALAATVAGAAGYLGARQGQSAQRRLQAAMMRRSGAAGQARVEAAELLERYNIPLQESDVASRTAVGPQRRDRLRQLLNPDEAVRDKRVALNEFITDTVVPGSRQDAVTMTWRRSLADAIDADYQRLRGMLPDNIPLDEFVETRQYQLIDLAEQVSPSRREDVAFWANRVIETFGAGEMTPQRWGTLRSNIASAARSSDNYESMSALYQVRSLLDEMVTRGDPEVITAMRNANHRWQVGEILDAPHVVNRELDINPNAFMRNLDKMFPEAWRGGGPDDVNLMREVMAAAEQFPAFRTSGTGEMLTASSITRQASARGQLAVGTPGTAIGGTAGRGLGEMIAEPMVEGFEAFMRSFGFSDDDPNIDDSQDGDQAAESN